MNKVYIFGFSGHGKVVADVARSCGYGVEGFIDDNNSDAMTFQSFLNRFGTSMSVALGVGDNSNRKSVYQRLKNAGLEVVTLVHEKAVIGSNVQILEGTVVMAGAIVNTGSEIAEGVIINSGAVIEHDNKIGSFSHVSPNACLAGNVQIGELSWIGIGANVIQGINIASKVIVGAGSVVINNINNESTVVGVPAKKIAGKNNG